MIIKNHITISTKQTIRHLFKWLWIAIGILIIISIYLLLPTNPTITIDDITFNLIGDAETKEGDYFVLNGYKTSGAKYQSSEAKFEGKYSVKSFAPNQIYCFNNELNNVRVGETIIVQVWVNKNENNSACLVLEGIDPNAYYESSCQGVETKGDWSLLRIVSKIDKKLEGNKLKFYCYNNTPNPVYFDNLSYYKSKKEIEAWTPQKIHLVIKEGEFIRLKQKRNEALKEGMLITTKDSWVKGAIHANSNNKTKTKVSLRLKGDWLDHLKGDKWSFRVNTQTDKAWNRLKTFSLQDPSTRSYLKEWVLHQLFKYEDILTTRYDFVDLVVNKENKGLYVYEEHFLKQIPEYNLKREGPIIKFTEGGLWESRRDSKKMGLLNDVPQKSNPDIRPFGEKRTKKDPKLAQQFEIAQNLLYQYRYDLKPAKDIFDLDLIAKYYAILDLAGAHHGLIWHNQRFYYNPVTSKLEPIGFDGYDDSGETWVKSPFVGSNLTGVNNTKIWHTKLFMEKEFVEKYIFYLNKFTQEKYINDFFSSIQKELLKRYLYIQKNTPSYDYTNIYFYNRAANIQLNLLPNSHSLKTRTLKKGKIAFCNRDKIALEVIGSATKDGGVITYLDTSFMTVSVPPHLIPDFKKNVNIPLDAKYIAYRVLGLQKIYFVEINPWEAPILETPAQKLVANLTTEDSAYFYDKKNKKVVFGGSAILKNPIIIPANYKVIFEAGCHLNMLDKSFILSYSPVYFMGLENNPILIESTDNSARGITILQAKDKSKINHTTFSGMNTFSYEGWDLTGAVTFYESDVDIYNSIFTKNVCEDALNIIRSNFLFSKSTVSHTFADGFDADFCIGTVDNSYFYETGNDGVDFSTSNITIKNTTIKNAGDKAISIGEQGKSYIKNVKIESAFIGIASKDLSEVMVHSVTLKNCKQGFAAYQKKPEYGGGKIIVENYKEENVNFLYKILPNSYLKLGEKEIKGN